MLKSTEKSLIKKMFLYPVLLIMFSFLLLMISSFITLKIFKKNEINKDIENLINSKKSYIKEHVVSLSQDVDNALKFSIDETKKSVKHRVYLIYYTVKSLYSLNKNKTFIIKYLII
ncbi:hypothetical protein [Lebetimonas sp. JS138]|uniref:hypothetical protein n=1 Tax=Lebetimonas sp. JS138 TaxID=990072 RepID=UPI000466A370|nr:hypothetical protein [Lebetimonas sp. JS138]